MKKAVLCVVLLALLLLASCQGEQSGKWYDFSLEEYITLGEYKNLSYSPVDPQAVTEEQVEQAILALLEQHSSSEVITGGTYRLGDEIKMNFSGVYEGEEERSSRGYVATIGEKNFFEEFEGGLSVLIDQPVQAKHQLDMTYKADHGDAQWAGKTLTVTMEVISITRHHKAEFTDAFVQSLGGAEQTAEEYRLALRTKLEAEAVNKAHEAELTALWQTVLGNSKVKLYPQKELNGYLQFFNDHYAKQAGALGMDVKKFQKLYYGVDEDQLLSDAKSIVKQDLVLFAICQKEGITLSNEEYSAFAEALRAEKGLESVAKLEESFGKDYVEKAALLVRVKEALLTWAKQPQAPVATTVAPAPSAAASSSAAQV